MKTLYEQVHVISFNTYIDVGCLERAVIKSSEKGIKILNICIFGPYKFVMKSEDFKQSVSRSSQQSLR